MMGGHRNIRIWRIAWIAMVAIVAGTVGAAAQTAGPASQIAARSAGEPDHAATRPATTPATLVISRTLGLGKLNFAGLTGGLVRNGDAPRIAASGNGMGGAAGETADPGAGDTVENSETASLIEASTRTLQHAIASDTRSIETGAGAIGSAVTPDGGGLGNTSGIGAGNTNSVANNGVGGGIGGGGEFNRGVGEDHGEGHENGGSHSRGDDHKSSHGGRKD